MGKWSGLVERPTMSKRKRKRKHEKTLEEPEAKTLGEAAPEPEPREPPPVQVVQRVRCPYCKTASVTWNGTKGRVRYYVCRECCDPGQGDMCPTRFKVLEAEPE